MKRIATVALATVLSACGAGLSQAQSSTADFVFQDGTGFVATVTLPDPLPLQSFRFRFQDPQDSYDGTFGHEREGVADCYFARGMPTICNRTPETDGPMPDRLSDGSRLSEQSHAAVSRYLLDDGSFADFRGDLLLRFGILREDGSLYFSYDRVTR